MTSEIAFTVPGEPRGKGRHRTRVVKAKGKIFATQYADEKTVHYENFVRYLAAQAMRDRSPELGPVEVGLLVTVKIPASWSKRKQAQAAAGEILPTGKPDLDNVEKAILDGMNGIAFRDDSQVCAVEKRKRYGLNPGVDVCVRAIALGLLAAG